MPRHDPVPSARTARQAETATAWSDYKRMMKWMALAALVTVALSLWWLASQGTPMRLHLVIATVAGVGLSVLVGTALMGLVFLSNRTGHDDDAAQRGHDDE
ncbi:MAG: hypothetical protein AB7H79_08380 [Sphingomonas sp.]